MFRSDLRHAIGDRRLIAGAWPWLATEAPPSTLKGLAAEPGAAELFEAFEAADIDPLLIPKV